MDVLLNQQLYRSEQYLLGGNIPAALNLLTGIASRVLSSREVFYVWAPLAVEAHITSGRYVLCPVSVLCVSLVCDRCVVTGIVMSLADNGMLLYRTCQQ